MLKIKNNIINAPASKSHLQRALILSLLAKNKILLKKVSWCNDTIVVLNILKELNVKIKIYKNSIFIDSSNFVVIKSKYFVGESGFAIRVFSIFFTLFDKEIKISASGSLKNRNLESIFEILDKLNIKNNYKLPIKIKGPITITNLEFDTKNTSQILSGLLLVLPYLRKDSSILAKNLFSKPYIDLTIKSLSDFGINILNNDYKKFNINGNQYYKSPKTYDIEGDWSGAAFFLVLGAIYTEIKINNLNYKSKQADKKIIEVLHQVGAKIKINKYSIIVSPNNLIPFDIDSTDCPDLFPSLVCLAAFCNGKSKITGVNRLTNKESNRAEVLKNEFAKINIKINIIDNDMFVYKSKIIKGDINSHNDHRIAMAASIIEKTSGEKIKISNKKCVNKSYPNFFKDLKKIKT